MGYIPLRNFSAYSFLKSMLSVDDLVKLAQKYELSAMGLADVCHLFGAMEFSLACAKKKIQPILGCILRIAPDSENLQENYHLPVFIQNQKGYENLCTLVTKSTVGRTDGGHKILTCKDMENHTEGLLALCGGPESWLLNAIQEQKSTSNILIWFQKNFPERWYIEIARQEGPGLWESSLIDLAYDCHIPLLATHLAYYTAPDDSKAHDILQCIASNQDREHPDRTPLTAQYHFSTPQDIEQIFLDLPEAIEQTSIFAQRCCFLLEPRHVKLPGYMRPDLPDIPADALRYEAEYGLSKRSFPEDKQQIYGDRLHYECEMISRMGFEGYFLIVADFIQWAKNKNIPVGPGRGSGASSLVAWALGITEVDPIRFNLLFERFLNPERVSMPDFDIDFCQLRRDEVIQYVQERYGADRVAHIITFGKLQARMVLRDVGRVLKIPYGYVDKICKLVPYNPSQPMSLREARQHEPQLNAAAQEDPIIEELLNFGEQLEGLYRHASTHAAGIVIASQALTTLVPLYQDTRSALPATEFSMKYIELAGLVKFDFLGLKTLTTLEEARMLVEKFLGIHIDLNAIPLDDALTFQMLCRGDTIGVFQLETTGLTDVVRQLQPKTFEEIIALVALFRPGPMADIPRYIACRHGKESVFYPYPILKPILEETFGVMVYQEQVLQIAQKLAGYSLSQADLLRRAMAKKIPEELEAQRTLFVEGVLRLNGGDIATATHLFEQITRFAAYAFPKAHATPYALIAYQTAYLKANYPAAYFSACMTLDMHHVDKLAHFVHEAQRLNIRILPPCVQHSEAKFTLENIINNDPDDHQSLILQQKTQTLTEGEWTPHVTQNLSKNPLLNPLEQTSLYGSEQPNAFKFNFAIRYGLTAIKNVGEHAAEMIPILRKQHSFIDIFDFFTRIASKNLNKRQIEGLIAAGALDALYADRKWIWDHMSKIITYVAQEKQPNLFGLSERPHFPEKVSWTFEEQLEQERLVLGFYFSAHPLCDIWKLIPSPPFEYASSYENRLLENNHKIQIITLGQLLAKKERSTRTGKRMAILHLSDPQGSYEAIVFDPLLSEVRDSMTEGQPYVMELTGALKEGQLGWRLNSAIDLATWMTSAMEALHLKIDEKNLEKLIPLSEAESGTIPCFLEINAPYEGYQLKSIWNIGSKKVSLNLLRLLIKSFKYCIFPKWKEKILIKY